MSIYYKIAQTVVNPDRAGSISRVYISQPDVSQEETVGRLLVLAEFPAKKSDYQALFNLIVEQLSIAYYQNEQILLLNKLATVTVATIFESAVSKINQILFELYQNQSIKFSADELNLTIAVIHENKIQFTNIGRNKALLIYKPKSQPGVIDPSFSLINITKKTTDPREDIFAPNKILANVVSGQVPQNGFFLFTNEALYEYLTERQLIKIITTLPPASAAAQIDNLLNQTQLAVPFSILILKNHKGQHSIDNEGPVVAAYSSPELRTISTHRTHMPMRPEKDINKESIRALNMTEDRTASILKPSGLFNYKKIFTSFSSLISLLKPRKKANLKILPAKLFDRKQSWLSVQKVGAFLGSAGLSIWTVIRAGINQLTNHEKRQNWIDRLKSISKRITKTHLIMIGIVIVCLTLFFANAYRLKHQSEIAKLHESFLELAKAIEKEESQIDADMLYNNKDKARTSLNKIGEMLKDFPQVSQDEKDEFTAIKARYQKRVDQINNIIRLTNLESEVNGKEGHMTNLVSIGDFLYLTVDNKIVKVDKKSKTYTQISDLDPDLKFGSTDKGGVYWLLAGNQILQINPSDKVKRFAIDAPSNIKGLEVYYNKLYLYTENDKQVYRYQLTTDGFMDKTPWLKNTEGLNDIRSLSIDGFVYLLDKDTVHQFGSGRKQNFSLSPVEPALTNPTKIIALKESDYLYILEPANQRLIVYNKKGIFLAQYTGDQLANLTDIAVDENFKMLYLLSGTTIYKTKLPQPVVSK